MHVEHPEGSKHTRMIGSALRIAESSSEHAEALRKSYETRQRVENPAHRDGPVHVITGGRQEGKTRLALEWLLEDQNHAERVLIVMDEHSADQLKKQCGLARSDQRIISFRRLRNGGARAGVEYGIDESVHILSQLLNLRQTPHLITVTNAAPWQG